MPPRSDKPGFKRGRHNLPYWIAKQVVRDPLGFPDICIPLPLAEDGEDPAIYEARLGEACRDHTARLFRWIDAQESGAEPKMPRYDGTVGSACQVYQTHPRSKFHKVKHNTRGSYVDSLKVIIATVGKRLVSKLSTLDFEHWYEEWRKPKEPGGPERIDRAHDAVSMAKTVIRFIAVAYRDKACRQLAEELKLIKFEKGGARQEEMTDAQASAFIRTALELGQRGVISRERALYLAIAVAAQSDMLLRQKDVIGDWGPAVLGERFPNGITVFTAGSERWAGFFTWENIPGWRWRMRTSKSKYRSPADFDLERYPRLMELLRAVPHSERIGAIVKGEHGLPIRYRTFLKTFRKIARAAGIPDEVWEMDARAGGATDAEESGVPIELIRDAALHSQDEITKRYIRRRSKKIAIVADARAAKRTAEEGK